MESLSPLPKTRKLRSHPSKVEAEGKKPQGVKKKKRLPLAPRKTSRLTTIVEQDPIPSIDCNVVGRQISRKRKRRQSDDTPFDSIPSPSSKRKRRSHPRSSLEQATGQNTSIDSRNTIDPIEYWTRNKFQWPRTGFVEPEDSMNKLLARKKSSASLREKQSDTSSVASSAISSDQRTREAGSAPYKHAKYAAALAVNGSFMEKSSLDISDTSKEICRELLETEQTYPEGTLFQDVTFDKACRKMQDRNEARVVQDIARLIVPSAETLATHGSSHLELLNDGVNEGWNSCILVHGPRPQPDYSVGFARSAFTNSQLDRLKPFVGDITETVTSFFLATWQMYFPFLTSEVKCGAAAVDVADRQNAHSMTIAVRGVVELFRLRKREKELHREILAFSISHDHETVRIYGHYPVIEDNKTTFYRHPIRKFDFTELDGKEKWTAYRFTKNVYDIWMPTHLKRICSVIDELPLNPDFEVSQLGESGLSQGLEDNQISCEDAASSKHPDIEQSWGAPQYATPDTSVSELTEERGAKKRWRKRGRV